MWDVHLYTRFMCVGDDLGIPNHITVSYVIVIGYVSLKYIEVEWKTIIVAQAVVDTCLKAPVLALTITWISRGPLEKQPPPAFSARRGTGFWSLSKHGLRIWIETYLTRWLSILWLCDLGEVTSLRFPNL